LLIIGGGCGLTVGLRGRLLVPTTVDRVHLAISGRGLLELKHPGRQGRSFSAFSWDIFGTGLAYTGVMDLQILERSWTGIMEEFRVYWNDTFFRSVTPKMMKWSDPCEKLNNYSIVFSSELLLKQRDVLG
jgi:hypothetical protein